MLRGFLVLTVVCFVFGHFFATSCTCTYHMGLAELIDAPALKSMLFSAKHSQQTGSPMSAQHPGHKLGRPDISYEHQEYRKEFDCYRERPWWGKFNPNYFVTQGFDQHRKQVELWTFDLSQPKREDWMMTFSPDGTPYITQVTTYREDGTVESIRSEGPAGGRHRDERMRFCADGDTLRDVVCREGGELKVTLHRDDGTVWADASYIKRAGNDRDELSTVSIHADQCNRKKVYRFDRTGWSDVQTWEGKKLLLEQTFMWPNASALLRIKTKMLDGSTMMCVEMGGTWEQSEYHKRRYLVRSVEFNTEPFGSFTARYQLDGKSSIWAHHWLDNTTRLALTLEAENFRLKPEWVNNPFDAEYQDVMARLSELVPQNN